MDVNEPIEYRGKSTDIKPKDCPYGSTFYEIDTDLTFKFKVTRLWEKETGGTNGADGIDGDSAYDIAVNNGFVGTEIEWLESLKSTSTEISSNSINNININKMNALHNLEPLITPTYEASGQGTHPSVIYIKEGFQGYKYIKAFTPYPFANTSIERPSIIVSNDKINWIEPVGITNPIANPEVNTFLADTNIILGSDGLLYVYYRQQENGVESKIFVTSSSNLITWSTPVEILLGTVDEYVSPNVIIEDGMYRMYYVNIGSPRKISYKESALPTSGFQAAIENDCIVTNIQSDRELWHIDVFKHKGKFYILQCLSNVATNGQGTELYMSDSLDGVNFEVSNNRLLSKDTGTWCENRVYQGSVVALDDNIFSLWYGGVDTSNQWRIGYAELNTGNIPTITTQQIYDYNQNKNPNTAYITSGFNYRGYNAITGRIEPLNGDPNAYNIKYYEDAGQSVSVLSEEALVTSCFYDPSDLSLYVGGVSNFIYQYALTTKNVFNSGVTYTGKSLATILARGFKFNSNKTRLYVLNSNTDVITQFNLSVGGDLDTAVLFGTLSLSPTIASGFGLAMSKDEKYMLVSENSTNNVYEINITTAGDITTGVLNTTPFNHSSIAIGSNSIELNEANNGFLITDNVEVIHQFRMQNYRDISSSISEKYFEDVSGLETSLRDICFSPLGNEIVICGEGDDAVQLFKLKELI